LFSIKATIGTIPLDGTWLGSSTFDNICAIAKSVGDLAAATEVIYSQEARDALPADGFQSSLVKDFKGLKVGFVDPEEWRLPDVLFAPDEKIRSEMVRTSYWLARTR
jgi:amidase